MNFGYVRVSTAEQNEARQWDALLQASVPRKNIYSDKQSGKDFARPQYTNLLAKLRPGDIVFILSIDRLGRNYTEIQQQWRILTTTIGADIVVLDMPLLDTRKHKDLLGTFIADLVLQILSFTAQNERDNIRARQAQGISAAKARGVKFGRPPKPLPQEFHSSQQLWQCGNLTASAAAKRCGMSLSSFIYKAKKQCAAVSSIHNK